MAGQDCSRLPWQQGGLTASAVQAATYLLLLSPISASSALPPHFALQIQLLNAIDAVCSHPELLIEHYVPVLSHLLPALSAAGAQGGGAA